MVQSPGRSAGSWAMRIRDEQIEESMMTKRRGIPEFEANLLSEVVIQLAGHSEFDAIGIQDLQLVLCMSVMQQT